MKLRYILSEDVDIQKHQAQLNAVSKRADIPQEDLINYLNDMDPNGNYTRWILKQIKFQNIRVPEDNHRVREALQQFDQNKQRLEVKDIMQYKRVSDLEDALEPVLDTGSKRKKALQYNPMALPGVEKMMEEGPFTVYHITDADSLAELGEGTKLCTRKSYPDCKAEDYIKNKSPIYIITKNNKLFAQIAEGTKEVKDPKNNPIDINKLPLNIIKQIVSLALEYAKINKTRVPEAEPYIMKEPEWAYWYTLDAMDRKRWPEAEPYIKQDPTWARLYERDTLNPEAEPQIMKDPHSAYSYALFAMEGERWPAAEPYIMKDPYWAHQYARDIIKGPWPEAEPYIMKDPESAYVYLVDIMGGERWPEAEPYIMKDPQIAYYYAKNTLKSPWPEAEPIIKQNPQIAYEYAQHVLQAPWPEIEPIIKQNPKLAYHYARDIIKGPWPEAEPIIKQDPLVAYEYAKYVIEGRWPEAEPYIMKDPKWAYYYAKNIIQGPWPEAEPYIKQRPKWARLYAKIQK